MSLAKGYHGQLLVDYETEFGASPVSVRAKKLPINSSQLKSAQNLIEAETIRGRRDPAEPVKGNIEVSGSVVVPVDEVAIGYWFKAMFGAPLTIGSNPYIHVFKPKSQQPSLVLEQGFTDIGVYEVFNGCKVSKFSITLGGDAELMATIDLMGAKETVANTTLDPEPTEIVAPRFNNFQASVQEGGSDIAVVTSATLNIDFGLSGDCYALGSNGYRTDLPEGIIKIDGNIKSFFKDRRLLDKALRGEKSSLKFTLTNKGHSLEFYLPEIIYERNSPGIEGSKGIMIDLPFRAYYADNLEETALIVTLINGKAGYEDEEDAS